MGAILFLAALALIGIWSFAYWVDQTIQINMAFREASEAMQQLMKGR